MSRRISPVFAALLAIAVVGCGARERAEVPQPQTDQSDRDPDGQLQSAIRMLEAGDEEEAVKQIERLARKKEPHLPACRFMVNRLVRSGAYTEDVQELQELTYYLKVVADSGDASARIALTQILIAGNLPEQAIEQLQQVVSQRPSMNLLLAQLLEAEGRQREGRLAAQLAAEHFDGLLKQDSDNESVRLSLASSLVAMGRLKAAADSLEPKAGESPAVRDALIVVLLRMADSERGDQDRQLEAVAALARALKYDNGSIGAWSRIYPLSKQNDEAARAAQRLVAAAERSKEANAVLNLVRGSYAFNDGDVDHAVEALESAYASCPEKVEIANNYAWYLAHCDPPRYERAIEVASTLVDSHPDRLEFRETRGQILALMNRDAEAIEDLQAALKAMPRHEPLIETLLKVYERQGAKKKAEQLRALPNKPPPIEVENIFELLELEG